MRSVLLSILMAVCAAAFTQEPAAPAPQTPQAPQAQTKDGNPHRQIPAKIVAGTIAAVDAEKRRFSVVRTDDEGKEETIVFSYDNRMRIYQRNKPMTVKDLAPGTGVKVHYAENRDGGFQVRRVMLDPPKADAPAQPGGTGN